MNKALAAIAAIVCVCVMLTGCTYVQPAQGSTLVVASFYPVYIFTLNLVEGTDIRVESLTRQSVGCLHDYRLLTGDVRLLSDADLFVMNGAGLESFTQDLLERLPELKTVDSSVSAELLYSEQDAASHLSNANSHIWMSVKNAQVQVNNICAALKQLCPDYASVLEANRAAYISRLEQLHKQLEESSRVLGDVPVITFHEAYDYMARELALNIVGSIESDEGGEPTARELGELTRLIADKQVRALYVEPDYTGSAAGILAAETGARVLTLNPVTSGEATLTAYEDIMRGNIAIITEESF